VRLLHHLVEAVDEIAEDVLVALALADEVDYVLEDARTVLDTELASPSRVLLAVLAVVGVEDEELEIYPGSHLLVLEGDGIAGNVEYGLKEEHPAVEVVEVAKIVGNLDVEGRVEHLEGFEEEFTRLLVIVLEDLLHDVLYPWKILYDELLEIHPLLPRGDVLICLSDLSEEINRGNHATAEIVIYDL
jgi:hypothetical protein